MKPFSLWDFDRDLRNMAGKMKSAKLESDIDRLRAEANWSKLLDLTKQISSKVPHYGNLTY